MIYAEVIGDPIAQSKSPQIHCFWLAALGIAADYRLCHVPGDRLANYLADRRIDPEWRGCNVTMPHKQTVMPLLDRIHPQALAIGAVNTIVRDADGTLTGHNTDAAGFLEPLREMLSTRHLFRMARIFGTGGAARAIIAALAQQNMTLIVAGRDPAKARALLDELVPANSTVEHYAVELDHFAKPTDFAFDDRVGCFDLVVNATALGMVGQPALDVDLSHVPPGSVVYDIVTTPIETRLLSAARAAGFRTIDGIDMLIGQAAVAFRLFFSADAPRGEDVALRALLTA